MLPYPGVLHAIANIRVTHRNGAIKHIFYTNQIHEWIISADCSLFILSLHALALHLAVKISNLSVWRFEHVGLTYICRCISPECQQERTLLRKPILLSHENIPNIWHKSSTKHKEVRPDWNDKNDNVNYALVSHEVSSLMAQLPFLKKYSIKCESTMTVNCFILNQNVTTSHIILLSSYR